MVMRRNIPLKVLGGWSFLAGIVILTCLAGLLTLPSLRGPSVVIFLALFIIAGSAYILAIIRLDHDRFPLAAIWGFAILFRLILAFTSPTLSDDVFRYTWDGHLLSEWINPYAFPVNSPSLDHVSTSLRELVNHNWMASPYLPASQLLFALIHQVAPESVKAFQIVAVTLDLITAWLLMDMLALIINSRRLILIYLWNPLVLVEFSHGAHVVDAIMICLVMLTFWLLLKARADLPRKNWFITTSVITLAAATLTKGLPLMFISVIWHRWGWKRIVLYLSIILTGVLMFAIDAGLGLVDPLDGRGVFGAIRIYLNSWNFNSGIFHWLDVGLSGIWAPGSALVKIIGERPVQLARMITAGLIALVVLATTWLSWGFDNPNTADHTNRTLYLLRLATLPIAAYLLFTSTVHPWYVTLVIPFVPFFTPVKDEAHWIKRFRWPWIYFSLAVSLSYLTYLNPDDLREYYQVRLVEYLPLYILLVWALWPLFVRKFKPSNK